MNVSELFSLKGRVALITGGSRGLGLQIAEALGEVGARVVLTARKQAELDQAQAHLRERGIDAVTLAGGIGTWRANGLPTEPLTEGDKP